MNSQKYRESLEQKLEAELRNIDVNCRTLFHQDSATCHVSKDMKKYFKVKKISCLDWPGNSPDLTPIENLWVIAKARPRKKYYTTTTKLIEY